VLPSRFSKQERVVAQVTDAATTYNGEIEVTDDRGECFEHLLTIPLFTEPCCPLNIQMLRSLPFESTILHIEIPPLAGDNHKMKKLLIIQHITHRYLLLGTSEALLNHHLQRRLRRLLLKRPRLQQNLYIQSTEQPHLGPWIYKGKEV
jgi:hypothetical protein